MNNNIPESDINSDDIITITDDDGIEHDCIILDIIEYKNKNYAALIPADVAGELNNENDESDENTNSTDLFIMEVASDDDGEFLVSIEGKDDYEEICQLMIDHLSDDFDIER